MKTTDCSNRLSFYARKQVISFKGAVGFGRYAGRYRAGAKEEGCGSFYYWDVPAERIYRLLAYLKNKQEDLTPAQLRQLRQLIKEWLE
jgi:hypothetical protein